MAPSIRGSAAMRPCKCQYLVLAVVTLAAWRLCGSAGHCDSFVGRPMMHRNPDVKCRLVPDKEAKYSADRLRSESEDGFSQVKAFFFGFGAVGAATGFLFIIPRLIGALGGAKNASPIETVLQDIAINATAVVVLGALTKFEFDIMDMRTKRVEEGALVARLKVRLPRSKAENAEEETKRMPVPSTQLSQMRDSKSDRPKRVILCMGTDEYCRSCIDSAAPSSSKMYAADLLLVPVPIIEETDTRTLEPNVPALRALQTSVASSRHVALPDFDSAPDDWETLCLNEFGRVKENDQDASRGLSVVIGKDGRVGMRLLGPPEWEPLAAEALNAKQLGSRV